MSELFKGRPLSRVTHGLPDPGYICLLPTPDGLCCNCGDEGIILRGETPIRNAKNLTFCSVECADEFDTRTEREAARRATDWCSACGYDNHEHAPDCEATPL